MTYEQTERDQTNETQRIAKANTPKAKYDKARREHWRNIRIHLLHIRKEWLHIRRAKLTYKIERK